MKPATVRIGVHRPIPTDGWSLDDLDQRIEDVRCLYEQTLTAFARGAPLPVG